MKLDQLHNKREREQAMEQVQVHAETNLVFPKPNQSDEKFKKLMDRNHDLCKEDIVWILNYIKQKAADEDPALLGLHQPRLLKNFHHYAEVASLLLQARYSSSQEYGHVRLLLREACYGLYNENE